MMIFRAVASVDHVYAFSPLTAKLRNGTFPNERAITPTLPSKPVAVLLESSVSPCPAAIEFADDDHRGVLGHADDGKWRR